MIPFLFSHKTYIYSFCVFHHVVSMKINIFKKNKKIDHTDESVGFFLDISQQNISNTDLQNSPTQLPNIYWLYYCRLFPEPERD